MSRDLQAINSTMPVIQSGSAASGRCAITRISDTELFRDLHQSTYGKFGISSRLAPTSSRQFQVNTPTSINAYASALRVYAVAINATRHALRSGSAAAGRCAITSNSKIFRDLRAMGDPAMDKYCLKQKKYFVTSYKIFFLFWVEEMCRTPVC